jgi:hypothetical protein
MGRRRRNNSRRQARNTIHDGSTGATNDNHPTEPPVHEDHVPIVTTAANATTVAAPTTTTAAAPTTTTAAAPTTTTARMVSGNDEAANTNHDEEAPSVGNEDDAENIRMLLQAVMDHERNGYDPNESGLLNPDDRRCKLIFQNRHTFIQNTDEMMQPYRKSDSGPKIYSRAGMDLMIKLVEDRKLDTAPRKWQAATMNYDGPRDAAPRILEPHDTPETRPEYMNKIFGDEYPKDFGCLYPIPRGRHLARDHPIVWKVVKVGRKKFLLRNGLLCDVREDIHLFLHYAWKVEDLKTLAMYKDWHKGYFTCNDKKITHALFTAQNTQAERNSDHDDDDDSDSDFNNTSFHQPYQEEKAMAGKMTDDAHAVEAERLQVSNETDDETNSDNNFIPSAAMTPTATATKDGGTAAGTHLLEAESLAAAATAAAAAIESPPPAGILSTTRESLEFGSPPLEALAAQSPLSLLSPIPMRDWSDETSPPPQGLNPSTSVVQESPWGTQTLLNGSMIQTPQPFQEEGEEPPTPLEGRRMSFSDAAFFQKGQHTDDGHESSSNKATDGTTDSATDGGVLNENMEDLRAAAVEEDTTIKNSPIMPPEEEEEARSIPNPTTKAHVYVPAEERTKTEVLRELQAAHHDDSNFDDDSEEEVVTTRDDSVTIHSTSASIASSLLETSTAFTNAAGTSSMDQQSTAVVSDEGEDSIDFETWDTVHL